MAENYLNATKPVRSYEISIWTLQDRFLSVLKWANQDCKGQIQEPEMVLRDDGTEELSFTIPKYYYAGVTKIENPLWLHLENQPLEANMHKLKVIFNKNEKDKEGNSIEGIFEFLVTSVAHDHNADELDLTVKAEGLAFHELGKIGYRISFSEETFETEIEEYYDKKMTSEEFTDTEIQKNIQYWNDLIFKDSDGNWKGNWKYEVRMDWSAYSNATKRESNKVYEDEYVSSWELQGNELKPNSVEPAREKWRTVEVSESNLYNITQTIAEQFGVYCRYEYEHDDNYQIKTVVEDKDHNLVPARTVVYYNNYYQDIQGHIDLTYPYSSSAITRTVDSSEVITKMYVQTYQDGDDEISIMDVDANKSKEDYLLNFDYLHEIQAITDEQYEEVKRYETQMHIINDQIIKTREHINVIKNQLVEVNAKISTLTASKTEAKKQWDEAVAAENGITGGLVDINTSLTVIEDETLGNYVNTQRWPGLVKSSIQLFENCNYTGKENQYSEPLQNYTIQYDDDGLNIIRLTNIVRSNTNDYQIYIKAVHDPATYYAELAERWAQRVRQDEAELQRLTELQARLNQYLRGDSESETSYVSAGMVTDDEVPLNIGTYVSNKVDEMRVLNDTLVAAWKGLTDNPEDDSYLQFDPFTELDIELEVPDLEWRLQEYLKQKAKIFNKFEKMMGPAMREGYWQPEDPKAYGHRYNDEFTFDLQAQPPEEGDAPETEHLQFIWDCEKYYENESPIIYSVGINSKPEPHLTIDLTKLFGDASMFKSFLDNLSDISFVYPDPNILVTILALNNNQNTAVIDSNAQEKLQEYLTGNTGVTVIDISNENLKEDSATVGYYTSLNNQITTIKSFSSKLDEWRNYIKPEQETSEDQEASEDQITPEAALVSLNQSLSTVQTAIDTITSLIAHERETKESGYSTRITQLQERSKILNKIATIINDDYMTPIARVRQWIPQQIAALEKNIYRVYRMGAGCELGWIIDNTNARKPVLIVTGASELTDEVIKFIITGQYVGKSLSVFNESYIDTDVNLKEKFKSIHSYIGIYNPSVNEDNTGINIEMQEMLECPFNTDIYICGLRTTTDIKEITDENGNVHYTTWEEYKYKRIYPRLYFNTMKLKDYSSTLKISANKIMLQNNKDYYIVPDERGKELENSRAGYYLTLKPEAMYTAAYRQKMAVAQFPIELVYVLSNTDVAIYLDAIKVMKENSRPKVEYDVELSVLNSSFIRTAYKQLNQIVHINDNDLHLEDVAGYISAVTLKLDKFWEDQVEIKNYETKFEDLFSTIVAQSEAMKKSAGGIQSAIQAFTSTGLIDGDLLQDSLYNKEDINFQFNNGELTIDNENGIWGRSTSRDGVEGVVAFRGGGIFTANKKDENDNWIWNTGIIPSGINASLITSGQLDTNRIKIYAGNELRFQLNGNGLFAYKGFTPDTELYNSEEYKEAQAGNQSQDISTATGIDSLQYVKYDSEGLALIAKKGTWYVSGVDYEAETEGGTSRLVLKHHYAQTVLDEIKRVEVSWRGLILRNWEGREVFYADPDTGNLTLEGNIMATAGSIGGWLLTDYELSGAGIRLVSGPEKSQAGIYLNPNDTYRDTKVGTNGALYYPHNRIKSDNIVDTSKVYYIEKVTTGEIEIKNNVYVEVTEISSVRPRYQYTDTTYVAGTQDNSGDTESGGTNEDDEYTLTLVGTQDIDNSTYKTYIMLNEEKTEYAKDTDGKYIEYQDGANATTSDWYKKLLAKYGDKETANYVIYTYKTVLAQYSPGDEELAEIRAENVSDTSDENLKITVQPQGRAEETFSVSSSDGSVKILKGQIGAFTLDMDGLSGGQIKGTTLDETNKLKISGLTDLASFGKVFYDIETDSDAGTFTLKRVDGTSVNFNIASMAAYKRAIEAAAAITLTVTVNGSGKVTAVATSGGGVTITKDDIQVGPNGGTVTVTARTAGAEVTRTVTVDSYGVPTTSDGGQSSKYCEVCQATCFKICSQGCQSTCSDYCARNCWTACAYGCGSACTGQCTGECGGTCSNTCGNNNCKTACKGTCGNGCGNNCINGSYWNG